MNMKGLFFGTAGVPTSAKSRDSISGLKRIKELGLGCMELEFVRGVKMGKDTAREIREISEALNIGLSVHAPYYINLNSPEEKKVEASVKRIIDSATIGHLCGAGNIVFHPAYYHKDRKSVVYKRIKVLLEKMAKDLNSAGIDVVLRPETTGKHSQFGTLDELLKLSNEVEGVLPCIDWAHLHARTQRNNSFEEFSAILSKIEEELGKEAINNFQCHVSGINYGKVGEKNHVNFDESDFKFQELAKALREYHVKGQVICESPNLEVDALKLQEAYRRV
jgi:deoxyribonuclease-4